MQKYLIGKRENSLNDLLSERFAVSSPQSVCIPQRIETMPTGPVAGINHRHEAHGDDRFPAKSAVRLRQ